MKNDILALVAEDDPTHRFVICSLLRKLDIDTQRAVDGEGAVEMAAALTPSIVFMDFNMPSLDGIEATRRIKAEARTANIPIIVVTADTTQRTRKACLDAGCAAVLVKPMTLDQMRDIVATHVC
ncbi:response regulator [Jannaschia donghaensis]|uniref:Sensor kinase protein RcsC n=1 Tax=Jannaschia donghaensis TaxID=420998 RepID=A0A0M6YND3_9RHOB|nr:response regulator [Jannaschia donghaensis]CTQ51440.1 Sensor kinase protein RcsC [Jannaschia donghaensis]